MAKSVDVYRRAWGGSGQRDGKLELVFALTTDFADGKSQEFWRAQKQCGEPAHFVGAAERCRSERASGKLSSLGVRNRRRISSR